MEDFTNATLGGRFYMGSAFGRLPMETLTGRFYMGQLQQELYDNTE